MTIPRKERIGVEWTLYDLVDRLYGSQIGSILDELVIQACKSFLDEGQAVWDMPGRRQGMFRAWSQITRCNLELRMLGLDVGPILEAVDKPEAAIDLVMTRLGIPEPLWMDYFTLELTKLHGWAGFVRWRSQAGGYYWQRRYPADLVDFLAIRLVLSLASMEAAAGRYRRDFRYDALARFLDEHAYECGLRYALHAGAILPELAHRVEVVLDSGDPERIKSLFHEHENEKAARAAESRAARLQRLCARDGTGPGTLARLPSERLTTLIEGVQAMERSEGPIWLQSLERTYLRRLLAQLRGASAGAGGAEDAYAPGSQALSNPKVQALFCIDVRSERLRRHLETIGNYDTYGVAGFFGIPVSFIEYGKGHETALCPAIVQPANVAIEVPHKHEAHRESLLQVAAEVVHHLKGSVLAPYVTVESVGLLFGLDMVGKTFAPVAYEVLRRRIANGKRPTGLMIDTLTRDEARALVADLQDELIVKAIDRHFGIKREALTADMIGEIREIALGQARGPSRLSQRFDIGAAAETVFVTSLRLEYQVNADQSVLQLEQLARIGFSIERQALLVRNTLKTIGLTGDFARFVLVVGHGSSSRNNPYESALDCGACGGDRGLVNARIFCAMANRREVREQLAQLGTQVPEDTLFIPALHDTTTDEVGLHDLDRLPPGRLAQLDRVQEDLTAAGRLCARERCAELDEDGAPTPREAAARAKRNALDWTQVRPEWGLSRNASFVVGQRASTRGLDLEGRAFLHSYDWRQDPDGRLLEGILSGPLIVAQWINLEHYFSTVDNEVFGSGSKVYHNVVGRFGVMTGNASDLRTGLPAQTVLRGERPHHEPMRLVTVIEAPLARVQGVLARVYKVRELVYNGWIRLVVLDTDGDCAWLFERGDWVAQGPWRGSDSAIGEATEARAVPSASGPRAAPAMPISETRP